MKVIGTELYDLGMDAAVAKFIALSQLAPVNRLVSPSDANVLVEARRNIAFRTILHSYFWNLPDGVPSAWLLKLKGAKNANRICGPDFFKRIILETKDLPINHFLCGGADGVADDLAEQCKAWGNQHVVGTYSPPFKSLEEYDYQALANQINAVNTTIVWIGLGAPKQIYFAHELAKFTTVQFLVPIGAAFDFHTNRVKKAPTWIQKIGMEWFYRLCQEPRRLAKRYFKVVPLFIFYAFVDFFKKK